MEHLMALTTDCGRLPGIVSGTVCFPFSSSGANGPPGEVVARSVPVSTYAKAYAAWQTLIATAKQKGEQTFQTLVALMGPPIPHFLVASSP